MAKYEIQSSTLTGICDAIRELEGTTNPIQVTAIAARIRALVLNLDEEITLQNHYIEQILAALDAKEAG